jgi:hypothetical protein
MVYGFAEWILRARKIFDYILINRIRVTIHALDLSLQFTHTRSSRQLLNVSLRLVTHEICEIQMAYL